MYFYDNTKSTDENLRLLMNDYNRICANLINNKVASDTQDVAIKSNVDYVAMMTDVDIPTDEEAVV